MLEIDFSYEDYQSGLQNGSYIPPDHYRPYFDINRKRFSQMLKDIKDSKNDYSSAFNHLRSRVGKTYFRKIYPMQSRALSFSFDAFPAYRLLLPEVLSSDWLATVDWHGFHRDHALHQPLTAYIVQRLLTGDGSGSNDFEINGKSLLDHCLDVILEGTNVTYLFEYLKNKLGYDEKHILGSAPGYRRSLWKSLFVETAYLAALFHDMGYPWQFINKVKNHLKNAEHVNGFVTEEVRSMVNSFGDRLLFYPFNGYNSPAAFSTSFFNKRLEELIQKGITKTHGLPGGIGFLYLNDMLNDFPTSKSLSVKQFCIEWAALAIMMHDMGDVYWGDVKNNTVPENPFMQLKFDRDPLSCIITLADVMQDFERPTCSFKFNDKSSNCSYPSHCEGTKLSFDEKNGEMKITYLFKEKWQAVAKRKYAAKEQKLYFDPYHGYLDLSALGINNISIHAGVKSKRRKP